MGRQRTHTCANIRAETDRQADKRNWNALGNLVFAWFRFQVKSAQWTKTSFGIWNDKTSWLLWWLLFGCHQKTTTASGVRCALDQVGYARPLGHAKPRILVLLVLVWFPILPLKYMDAIPRSMKTLLCSCCVPAFLTQTPGRSCGQRKMQRCHHPYGTATYAQRAVLLRSMLERPIVARRQIDTHMM